ncbi:sensor histidine kinase [Paenibacillus contaminans]|uniref:Sensor histidine kinase n=1 Tax=Paenibacillus contaminans TaxID=450362 RepID=A0A329M3H5_9BACL|nr:sensor histidine kinase [Paenibacillus contaminans]RAV14182.1 sensor histidine kinase [Paenibacillus contaminans]
MYRRLTIFTKVVVLVLGLLIPVIGLYAYSNQQSVNVIKDEIKQMNFNKLVFLLHQMDAQIQQLSTNSLTMVNDPAVRELNFTEESGDFYERKKLLAMVQDHINLQATMSGWVSKITVWSKQARAVVSTDPRTVLYDDAMFADQLTKGWRFKQEKEGNAFVWFSVLPLSAYEQPSEARMIVRISFSTAYLQNMLDGYKANGNGNPFLYHPELGVVANRTADVDDIGQLSSFLSQHPPQPAMEDQTVVLNGKQYMVSSIQSQSLGWHLIDFVPMDTVLAPITKSRNLFYISTLVLLCVSVLASFVLYRNVQVPIRKLIRNVQRIRQGDYSTRIKGDGGSEFSYLFQVFNEMSQEIEQLVGKVYVEQLRSKEAMLKQLQSQINPHFLYNCLFYIKSMARLGDEEAVVAMSLNLGEYFRYTTRLGKQTATLQEEVNMLNHYLTIQKLRLGRLDYRIDISDGMQQLELPRLIIQPIVENALVHGIEPSESARMLRVMGESGADEYRIVVEDDGIGMEGGAMAKLEQHVMYSSSESESGCGLWNVNQRLKLMFGKQSGLRLSVSDLGGLKVTVTIRKEEADDV